MTVRRRPTLSGSWQAALWRLAALVAGAVLAGYLLGAVALSLCLALAAYLLWTLGHLLVLKHWLRSRRRLPPPEGWGVWADIYELLYRRQREEYARKKRLLGLLRAFRQAAATLPDGTLILDQGHHLVWFNAAACRLLGLRYPQDVGRPLTNLARHPRLARWLEDEPGREPLVDLPAPSGEDLRLGLRMLPYAEQHQMLVVRDISTLMRLEQVRRDFVANVSHELRTPLTVVRGYLEELEPEELPEWAPILRELRSQAKRMTQIDEDLLTLSRLEAEESVQEERVQLRPLLAALKREAEALSQGRHRIETSCESEADLSGSGKDLVSAFSNLVSNAIRYTPAGGRIRLSWASDDGAGRFTVEDTGQGIPPQHLPRITERFYRVSTSRSRETGGTGLGLSIVKHVLNLHQARLAIESEPGIGSRFSCIFPPERLLAPLPELNEARA